MDFVLLKAKLSNLRRITTSEYATKWSSSHSLVKYLDSIGLNIGSLPKVLPMHRTMLSLNSVNPNFCGSLLFKSTTVICISPSTLVNGPNFR